MEILERFMKFTANINLGQFYPLIVSCSSLLVSTALLILTIFVRKIKKSDKTLPLTLSLFSYFSCAYKVFCDFTYNTLPNLKALCVSLFICAISILLFSISLVLSKDFRKKKYVDNQLIERLLQKSGSDYGYFLSRETSEKEREFLQTDKMFTPNYRDDFGINYSQILYYIDGLKQKDLSFLERESIAKLECDVKRLSHVNVNYKDRDEFSQKITELFKLMSKYA